MKLWKRDSKTEAEKPVLRCSFCGKSQQDVKKLIAGPTTHICDECVAICVDIVANNKLLEPGDAAAAERTPLKCALCSRMTGEPFEIPDRGALCPGCVLAVQSVTFHSLM